jgi:hypothetical protein
MALSTEGNRFGHARGDQRDVGMLFRPDPKHLVPEALPHEIDAFEIEDDLALLFETVDEPFRLRPADELGADRNEPDDGARLAELEVLRVLREYLGEVVKVVNVDVDTDGRAVHSGIGCTDGRVASTVIDDPVESSTLDIEPWR